MFSRLLSGMNAIVLAALVALALGLGVSGSAAPGPCKVGTTDYPNSQEFQIYTYDADGAHATKVRCIDGVWEGVTIN